MYRYTITDSTHNETLFVKAVADKNWSDLNYELICIVINT